jgi:hypothetical protein
MPKPFGPGIVITRDTLSPNLKSFPKDLRGRIGLYMKGQSTRVQDYARRNAPWTDRTSNARNGLFAQYNGDLAGDRHVIRVYHTVPYGIWLEIRWAGKYAIIFPTVQSEGARILAGMNKLIEKSGFSSAISGGGIAGGSGLFA